MSPRTQAAAVVEAGNDGRAAWEMNGWGLGSGGGPELRKVERGKREEEGRRGGDRRRRQGETLSSMDTIGERLGH